jgi:hypothetical protein
MTGLEPERNPTVQTINPLPPPRYPYPTSARRDEVQVKPLAADLKRRILAMLPGATVKASSGRSTWTPKMRIEIKLPTEIRTEAAIAAAGDWRAIDPLRARGEYLRPEISAALDTIREEIRKYRRDDSDPMTDYFSCNFYYDLTIAGVNP